MFEIVFLGHQGWLFTAGESRLLVDPLLTPGFGHFAALGAVHPPRRFSFDALPPIAALFLTHEHEDHFDVPSLARIDRKVPVLLSAHSSRAAGTLLAEMGFQVRRVRPGEVVRVGDLALHLFSPGDRGGKDDEWDVLPFLVIDRRGHGGFFTTVDAEPHERLEDALRAAVSPPPVRAFTNNVTDFSFAECGKVLRAEATDTARLVRETSAEDAALRFANVEPPAVVFAGGGFAFEGDRAWMNLHAFPADSASACAALSTAMPHRTFRALLPGETLVVQGGRVQEVRPSAPFLQAAPRGEWPSRDYAGPAPKPIERYAPATSTREPDADEMDALRAELDAFAAHLCSREIFRSLLSLEDSELGGRRPTFSLVALCDGDGDGERGAFVFEYDPSACAFVPARSDDPVNDYVGGLECWARDLLAVFRGELAPSAITFGRSRSWSFLPARCRIHWGELWIYAHPLRRPDRFLHLYRSLHTANASAPVCVRAAEPSADEESTNAASPVAQRAAGQALPDAPVILKALRLSYEGWGAGWAVGRPSPRRAWMDEHPHAYACLPLVVANQWGWELRCPADVTATWDGSASPGGIVVTVAGGDAKIYSGFGQGILTFSPPWIFRTSPGWNLLCKGPSNHWKKNCVPLDGVVETWWLPYTFSINWKLLEPGTVHFAKGEPIAHLVPVPHGTFQGARALEGPIREADPATFTQWVAWGTERTRRDASAQAKDRLHRHYKRGEGIDGHLVKVGVPDIVEMDLP
jgi:hypothetical protein